MPVLLPPSGYDFDIPAGAGDLVGTGADLEPATLLDGYRSGLFPMGLGRAGAAPMGWWSPQRRGCSSRRPRREPVAAAVGAALRDHRRHRGGGGPRRLRGPAPRGEPGSPTRSRRHTFGSSGWGGCTPSRYGARGARRRALRGGDRRSLRGESMFHTATDASKVALVALVEILAEDDDPRRLIDVQWSTSHLSTLGSRRCRVRGIWHYSPRHWRPLPRLWRSAGSSA